MKFLVAESEISGIPTLSISPEGNGLLPLVVYIHGYGGDKAQALDFGYMLAKRGFFFLSFDCMDHGDRNKGSTPARFKPVYPQDSGLDTYIHMHEVVRQTKEDLDKLIDCFSENKQIDCQRMGITGFSMGGYAVFYNAAYSKYIKVAAAIAGKPAFKKAWEDITVATSTYEQWSRDMELAEHKTEQRTAFLAEIDPYDHLAQFAPKPLLIVNGDQDMDQPYLYSLELYKQLIPYYRGNREKFKLSLPIVDHSFTYEIKQQVCEWFERYL